MEAPWTMLPPLHAPTPEERRLNHVVWAISTLRVEAAMISWRWPSIPSVEIGRGVPFTLEAFEAACARCGDDGCQQAEGPCPRYPDA